MTVSDPNEERAGDEPKRSPSAHEVDFPPVENGVDYLRSVVEHLTAEKLPGPRHLKYAVLHLQAATEVLLKARLQREHWSLVFANPGLATRRKFESGDFESCTTNGAIARLKDIVGISLPEQDGKSLEILAKSRNALQHYGLTDNARAVEARAAKVLDILMAFLHYELLPVLPDAEAEKLKGDLEVLGEDVRTISSFVDRRVKRLKGQLKDRQDVTVECPSCDQWALVIGEQDVPTCHFCHHDWVTATRAAELYEWTHYETSDLARDARAAAPVRSSSTG